MYHEIVASNPDIETRFYLSEDFGSYVPPHWHDSLEIIYMLEGSMTVACEQKKIELDAGDIYIINSREIHAMRSRKNRAFVLQIPKEFLKRYMPDIEFYYFEINLQSTNEREQESQQKLRQMFVDMNEVYEGRSEGYLFRFNSLLYELIFRLIQCHSQKVIRAAGDRSRKHLERLNEIMGYLKLHYREKCKVSELAEKFGYNEDYLARFFKKQLGMTIIEYLYAVRITKVYQDLIQTDKSIGEIFEEHGCLNYRVTMRMFKEKYGCTPKEKRKEEKCRLSENRR